MPTYEVTDSLTGKTYELTGDSPPTEQELGEMFSGAQKASAIQQPLTRTQMVEQGIAKREDVFPDLSSGEVMGPTDFPIRVAGGIGQRLVAGISNPILAMQQGRAREAVGDIGKGLAGERLGEFGDILRQAGAPEPVAATGGLIGESFVDPVAAGVGLGRIAAMRGTAKVGKILAKKGLNAAASTIHDIPETMKKDIIADRGAAFNKDSKYWGDTALPEMLNNLTKSVSNDFYKPAQETWKNLGEKAATVEVTPQYVEAIAQGLEDKFKDSIVSGRDEGIIARTIATLRSLGKGGPTGILGANMKPLVSQTPITVKDLIEAKADLRAFSNRSKPAMEAASEISNRLASDFDFVAKANKDWQLYRQADEALRRAGIKVDATEGELVVDAAQAKIRNFYTDKMQAAKAALLGAPFDPRPSLVDVYKGAGKDSNKATGSIDELKRVLQAQMFESHAPIGSATVGRAVSLPIGIAAGASLTPVFGPFAGAVGALTGGTIASKFSAPRSFARMWHESLQDKVNPRGRIMQEIGNRRFYERALDVGVGRQLSGRESQ